MEKIIIIVTHGTGYVWNVKDWLRLRNLRIVGNLVGSLAALPRQDQLGGLPLALLKEEVTILLEKDYAVTNTIPNLFNPPSEDIRKRNDEYFEKIFSEQSDLLRAKRKREIESKIDIIIEGKKAKRKCPEEPLNKETVLEEEFKKLQPIKSSALAIHIPTGDPWLEDKDFQECSWVYPESKTEHLHYSVFKDLWERGFYITPGGKFGGDYLAYPGDPIKFHAFFIIICKNKDEKLSMNEIITYGRLGQSVRKTVILAFLSDNKVIYQSVQWSGF